MKSKTIAGIMLTLLLMSVLTLAFNFKSVKANPQSLATTKVSISPVSIIGPPPGIGETFNVNITITNVISLTGWQIGLKWDPTVLQCLSFTPQFGTGKFLGPWSNWIGIEGTINNTSGNVYPPYAYAFIGATSPNGSGALAQVEFQVLDYGFTWINLIYVYIESNHVLTPVDLVNGTFALFTAPPPSGPTTVYLDPSTINGTVIAQEFTVNIMIRAVDDIHSWGAGLIFNATLLNCIGFFEGEFLKNVASTAWTEGDINNTSGVITQYGSAILGDLHASGSGRLAYATFKVKATGVSDLHLRDAELWKFVYLPIQVLTNIIDTYTVVVDSTSHTVVIVSNSTGKTGWYHSGFYAHAFNPDITELSFNVTGPYLAFSNVSIPDTLVRGGFLVLIDGIQTSRTVTYNGTHHSIYFTYGTGIHKVRIKALPLVGSTISIALSSTSIILGSSVTISGDIDPLRLGVAVTILYRPIGGTWNTLATVITDQNSHYSYTWMPQTAGTYQVRASWPGDNMTMGDESDVLTLTVTKVSSTISVDLSTTEATLGSSAIISGAIHPQRPGVTVTILYRPSGGTWATLATVITDSNGCYSYVWTPWIAGTYEVRAAWSGDANTNPAESAVLAITIREVPSLSYTLDVEMDAGSIHFRGEIAEFYILVSSMGEPVDADISAILYYSYGTLHEDLTTSVEHITTGLYRVPYTIPSTAPAGTYTLVVNASYLTLKGASLKTFLLSTALTGWNAWLVDIQGNIATIKTDIVTVKASLEAINATLVSIEGRIATINSTIGMIRTDANAINANIAGINGTIVTINSALGSIQQDISAINGKVKAINGTIATIQTTLGTIEGRITSIEGRIATIETDVGTIKTMLEEWAGGTTGMISTPLGDFRILVLTTSTLEGSIAFFDNVLIISLSGSSGTTGTTNVVIPKQLLVGIESSIDKVVVTVDDERGIFAYTEQPEAYVLHITYTHSTHLIKIYLKGLPPTPFPAWVIVTIILIVAIATGAAFYMLKIRKPRIASHPKSTAKPILAPRP